MTGAGTGVVLTGDPVAIRVQARGIPLGVMVVKPALRLPLAAEVGAVAVSGMCLRGQRRERQGGEQCRGQESREGRDQNRVCGPVSVNLHGPQAISWWPPRRGGPMFSLRRKNRRALVG